MVKFIKISANDLTGEERGEIIRKLEVQGIIPWPPEARLFQPTLTIEGIAE